MNPLAAEHKSCPALDSVVDLPINKVEVIFGGKGSKWRLGVRRIARDELRQLALEAAQELVSNLLLKDEALGTHAALAGVVHAAKDGPFDRLIHISIVEDDVGITPPQLHRGLLESLTRLSSHGRTGSLAPGQRDTLDAGIGNDRRGLLARAVDVGLRSRPSAGIEVQLFKCRRALRDTRDMLPHQRIAA